MDYLQHLPLVRVNGYNKKKPKTLQCIRFKILQALETPDKINMCNKMLDFNKDGDD